MINIVILAGTGVLLWYQIRSNHEWERRKTTNDVLMDMMAGRFTQLRRNIELKIDPYDVGQSYTTKKAELTAADEQTLTDLLNYLEQVCVAIKHGILDEDISFEMLQPMVGAYWRWAEPYVLSQRIYSPRIWLEIQEAESQWREREKKTRDGLRLPRKPRL